jgi:hypothetical protein
LDAALPKCQAIAWLLAGMEHLFKSPGWMKRLEVSSLQILVFLPPKHLPSFNCQWILLNGEVQGQ